GRASRPGVPMMLAINASSSTRPRRTSSRRAASAKTRSVSISRPSRSKTTARTGVRSSVLGGRGAVIGIDVGELGRLDRLGGQFAVAVAVGAVLAVDQGGHVVGVEVHGALALLGRRLARPQVDLEAQAGDRQLVVGQQRRPADALAVDTRAVGAAEVAQQEQ